LEIDSDGIAGVLQMVSIARALGEGRAIASAEKRLAVVLDQDKFALEDEDELVLMTVPMALAGPLARRQCHQIDSEVPESSSVTEGLPGAPSARIVKGPRVASADALGNRCCVDLRHCCLRSEKRQAVRSMEEFRRQCPWVGDQETTP